ncbi:MAG: leucyl aminopeptidase family protein [Ilumatobacteraceae bacterium]|jgi:leucyl aminopeptidase
MTRLEIITRTSVPSGATVARGVYIDQLQEFDSRSRELQRLVGFNAAIGDVHTTTEGDSIVVLVGLGERGRLDPSGLRRSVASLVRACSRSDVLATTLLEDALGTEMDDEFDAVAAATSIVTASLSVRYRFDQHRSAPNTDGPRQLVIVHPPDQKVTRAIERADIVFRGVELARDLVNEPGGTLTPTEFARRCMALAGPRLQVVVHDFEAVRNLGMGGLLGVNSGSDEPPAFVEMHYTPAKESDRPRLALVGKGITYDSGGVMLKQKASSLLAMKNDMGGAAAIIGAMSVFADLDVPAPVSAYLPMTDNMSGGGAYRPGDVLRMYDGTTVEVLDTDAEGRIVLGDALAYARKHSGASAALSVATLTGTAIHATGVEIAALIGRDENVIDGLLSASRRCSDRLWQLPRVPEYRFLLKSSIADMTNRSEAPAATSFAALFLEPFIGDIPWAHIDMAAVATRDRDTPDGPAGARGWGVELLVEYASVFGS